MDIRKMTMPSCETLDQNLVSRSAATQHTNGGACACGGKSCGKQLTAEEAPTIVCMSAEYLGYKNAGVEIPNEKVLQCIREFMADKKGAAVCLKGAWEATRNLNIKRLYKKKGQAWQDFCDDVVLFNCASFVLFGKAIPIRQ